MTAEQRSEQPVWPAWAAEERERDLAWIGENAHVFWPLATTRFSELGRGAITVNTMDQIAGNGHPMGYFPESTIAELDDEDTARIVHEYDPEREFVVFVLKPAGRTSTYRVRPMPGGLAKLQ